MTETWRFVVFLTIVLSVWTGMHAFVLWRLSNVPPLANVSRALLLTVAAILWLSYPLAQVLDRIGVGSLSKAVELIGASWLGILFMLFVWVLLADVVTGFGRLLPSLAPILRAGAALVALGLSAIALIQGGRAPIVSEHEVHLAGLPRERDGLVLVVMTDLHVGTLLDERWMARQVERANALAPDLVAIVGDLVDGNATRVESVVPTLRQLRAPLGVWAVTGNHEFYAGLERSLAVFEQAGFRVLRDCNEQVVPGLVLAGVDDLTARRQFGLDHDPLAHALDGRPAGATILLSHTPWHAEQVAARAVGLMLSGHTHDGQIWPFGYLVRLSYPLVGGRYEIAGMTAIVCRGTGFWGPPMRLWRRSEILRITLRSR
jgi:predicted MPP superfamily phosphohydrolase